MSPDPVVLGFSQGHDGAYPVLLYHSVTEKPARGDRRWTVSRPEFAAHVEALESSGRVALGVTELAVGLRGELPLPERAVAMRITFDDGFADTAAAVELLLGRGLGATVYVTTGEIGRPDRLSPAELAELARLPAVELGAHSVHHDRLDELGEADLADEVGQARPSWRTRPRCRCGPSAYPHGAYDERARKAVVDAGYGRRPPSRTPSRTQTTIRLRSPAGPSPPGRRPRASQPSSRARACRGPGCASGCARVRIGARAVAVVASPSRWEPEVSATTATRRLTRSADAVRVGLLGAAVGFMVADEKALAIKTLLVLPPAAAGR